MKKYLIPYTVLNTPDFWTGIDFYNHSHKTCNLKLTVEEVLENKRGERGDVQIEINPFSHVTTLGSSTINKVTNGAVTIKIESDSDDLYITAFIGTRDKTAKPTSITFLKVEEI